MLRANGVIIAVCLLLTACGHQAPQRPSQRKGEAPKADSAQLALLELNQQLAIAADQQLAQWAQEQDRPYALYESNVWMTILLRGDEETPATDKARLIAMRIYNMNGQLLEDVEGSYRIGRRELPQGVEANIGELHRGGKARMAVPWYAAFGITGTDNIPPYENVIIDVEWKE